MKVITALLASLLLRCTWASVRVSQNNLEPARLIARTSNGLQDIVTWDEHSLFIYGERVMLYSGSFHPFRLPVPGLWLDIFQKIKAMGRNTVTFYLDWALFEGKQGDFSAEGVFAIQPFLDAASEAGIYLIARPGPYINAEVSGGGFPGWLQRSNVTLRTSQYFDLTVNYLTSIDKVLEPAQITNGGPIIMVQIENELTGALNATYSGSSPLEKSYMQAIEDLHRANGIVVPLDFNDAGPAGDYVPGSGNGSVDIYGFDSYPFGIDCGHVNQWAPNPAILPSAYYSYFKAFSPTTPNFIPEAQGGNSDVWGGPGTQGCIEQFNTDAEKVVYKNFYSFGITMINFYMTYGGTNWGNIAYPQGPTSYDYGAVIAEDRTVARQKFGESKLQSNFLKVSPAYLTSWPSGVATDGAFVDNAAIATTQLVDLVGNKTNMYIVRQALYYSQNTTNYKLAINTSIGALLIPTLRGQLTLNGRDSKIHVSDYKVGSINLIYSTAEIFTWKQYGSKTVLVVYGGIGETHEMAFPAAMAPQILENARDVLLTFDGKRAVLNFHITAERSYSSHPTMQSDIAVEQNAAYNYWTLDLPSTGNQKNYSTSHSVIINGGYLLRTARINGNTLYGRARCIGDGRAVANDAVEVGCRDGLVGVVVRLEFAVRQLAPYYKVFGLCYGKPRMIGVFVFENVQGGS